jgi:zinc protease
MQYNFYKLFSFSKTTLVFLFIFSSYIASSQQRVVSNKPIKSIDKNGYAYETYTNDPAGVRLYKLKNGLTVYLAQNFDEPKVRPMVCVRGGSSYESIDNTGVAHYLEHLLSKGNDKIGGLNPKAENALLEKMTFLYEKHKKEKDAEKRKFIYKSIDSLSKEASKYGIKGEYHRLLLSVFGGAFINAGVKLDNTTYWCTISSNYLEPFLALEKERFSQAPLRTFPTELEIVYEEFNTMQDEIFQQKYYGLRKMLYNKHPYGRHVIGLPEHLKTPSMQAVKDYFNKFYIPNNMAITLVGDLDFEKTIQLVDGTFGKLKPGKLILPTLPEEKPMSKPVETEIFSDDEESINIGFRMKGANSSDHVYVELIDILLANGKAGLMDIALNTGGKVNNVSCNVEQKLDYSTHEFTGSPKPGQTLEQVKELILEQIERIKSGDFEEWLIKAVIAEIKKDKLNKYGDILNLSAEVNASFVQMKNWGDVISLPDRMDKISKKDIMEFAQKHYDNNYAVVYKRKGVKNSIVKVEKPSLSPILLNNDKESEFSKKIKQIKTIPLTAQFVDATTIINKSPANDGIEVSFIENKKNSLFELNILFDFDRVKRKDISLGARYMNQLGTNKYTAGDFKMEFYKLGLSFSIGASANQVIFSLSGLQDNIGKGIELINHFMENAKPDNEAYADYVKNIVSTRKSNTSNKNIILNQGLINYALYGENSPLRDIYSEEELSKIKPENLVSLITGLRKFKHQIFFFGKDLPTFTTNLNKYYKSSPSLVSAVSRNAFTKIQTSPVVYFVHKEMAQAELIMIKRCDNRNKDNFPFSSLFYRYIDDIVSKEIREKRSLAYNAFANYTPANDANDFDYFYVAAGTQADKVPETLNGLKDCLLNLPGSENQFTSIKENVLKRMEAKRLVGSAIFWDYETIKERGFPALISKEVYEAVKKYTLNDLKQFHQRVLTDKNFTLLVVGDKNKIDMKALAAFGEIKEMDVNYLFNYR